MFRTISTFTTFGSQTWFPAASAQYGGNVTLRVSDLLYPIVGYDAWEWWKGKYNMSKENKDEIVVEEQGCGLDETCDMDIEKVLSEEENIKLLENAFKSLFDKIWHTHLKKFLILQKE